MHVRVVINRANGDPAVTLGRDLASVPGVGDLVMVEMGGRMIGADVTSVGWRFPEVGDPWAIVVAWIKSSGPVEPAPGPR